MKGYFLDAFEECDKDLNNELTGQEIDEFVEKMRYFFLKQRFESMDKNNDGIIGVDDMPTAEEATQQLEEAMEKMQATVEKIDKMDSNTIAEGWIKSIGAAVADEDFYQMDRDRNGCLSREEYVHYQMETDNSSEEDGAVKMTALDYTRWYLNIKKSQKDCLTKEEYIADQNLPIEKKLEEVDNEENEKIYAGILFEEIDTDSSEKITAEEYAEYNYQRDKNLYAPNEPVMKKEDYYNSFMRIMAPDKGWMNKEEFIEGYIKERVKNKEEFSEEDLEEIENEDKIETEEEVKGEENAKEE